MFAWNRLSDTSNQVETGRFSEIKGSFKYTYLNNYLFECWQDFLKRYELRPKTFAHNFFFIYFLLHISFTIQLKCFTSHFFSMKTVQSHFFINSGVNWQTDFPVQATRFLIGANAQSLTCGYVPDRGWSLTKVSQRLFLIFNLFIFLPSNLPH